MLQKQDKIIDVFFVVISVGWDLAWESQSVSAVLDELMGCCTRLKNLCVRVPFLQKNEVGR
jgi:hypothetical protein